MKNKRYSIISILTTILIISTMIAIPIQATPNYNLTGTWTWNYYFGGNTYTHEMRITSFNMETGEFTGDGEYIQGPGWVPGYTWTLEGTVVGDDITYEIVYTGINAGYTVNAEGEITQNGLYMSGDATGTPTQIATWDAEKEIPITLTFPPGSTAEANIEILTQLPPCTPALPDALDIIPLISVKIVSGSFDGFVQVCIQYDDTGMTDEDENNLQLFISNCVDFNLDRTINGKDISLIMKGIKNDCDYSPNPWNVPFDVNNDGEVDEEDVLIVKEYATKGLIVNMGLSEEDQARLPWIDITTSVDIENNIICGETDHFSIFRCR